MPIDLDHSSSLDTAERAALDAVPGCVLLYDASGALKFANRAAHKLLGEGAGMPHLIDPATERPVPPPRLPLARALRGESVEGEEYLVRRLREGATLWFECGASPIRTAEGSIAGAVLTLTNITARKKRELAKDSAAQLRDFIYHENLAGIIHSTVDGRILDCNDAMVRIFGYESKQELLAMRASQLYWDPGDRDRLLRLAAQSGRLNEFELCFRRKNGTRCWAILNVRFLDAPAGEVGGSVVSTVLDITERRRQEETLRESERRFSAFMRHLPGIAFIKDLKGKYVYYNEASTMLFGMKPDEIVGKTDDQIWPAENARRYRESDAAVVAEKRPLEFVEPVAQPGGTHSWRIYKFPIIENGKVLMVGGVGIDVTERTILEDQLAQARKMEALGRLAGGVAHDFNNLLTVISGYGQMALEGAGTAPTERMITWLQEVLNSSRRASALTGQLLAFSRHQAIQPALLDLGSLLHNMERLLQRVIGEHVDLSVRAGHEACLILADAHQIEQVIMNLAVNSRDAMPLGGTLEIRCERLAEPVPAPAGDDEDPVPLSILLEVRDTGIGMDETIRPQIFDPFFTSKEKGRGTGLGLSMVYGIVSQAHGRIDVESVPAVGTVFRVYFPEAEGEVEPASLPRMGTAPKGRETVLLVEDEISLRTLAETILTRLGYRVLAADSGAAAVDLWERRRGRIDVLLTDVIMPQMSGGDLAHLLRAKSPGLKVLFMSGYTDDMLASHGVLAGETQLIQKPFTAEALGRKLRDVLDA
ncbi:MAG: PAS domain-containing protein [Acidobacteriota bacterium]|nr:PAS domain-containing protein [Acidobacteriota bacterium]